MIWKTEQMFRPRYSSLTRIEICFCPSPVSYENNLKIKKITLFKCQCI